MWSRVNRLKHLDTCGLHHTEWSKRLGSVGIAAFLTSVGFPMGIFLLIPYCAREIAGPSTSLSILMVFVVTIMTGLHLVEMSGRIPKSGCTYAFVYVTFGELWAFLCAWITVFDYCAMTAYLAKSWSVHFDFMFHGNVRKYMNPALFVDHRTLVNASSNYANMDTSTSNSIFKNTPIFDEHVDILAAVGLVTASLVALLGLSVISTICMSLLVVGALVVSSSILVGFFYANVANWSQHGFFIAGIEGICTAASYLLRSMIGIEMVGSLIEETTNPQNRFAILFPVMNTLLFIYLFIMSVVVTLVIPYEEIPMEASLPSIYGLISVPASRYVLSVGSICALSGALLSSLSPPIRYLHSLSSDGLLCSACSKFPSFLSGVPLASFVTSFFVTAILLFFETSSLLAVMRILLPARFLILTAATLMQRYRDTPSGLLAEVANYKAVQFKSKSMSSFFSGAGTSAAASSIDGSGMYNGHRSSVASRNASDRYSISSSFIMRNIAAAQYANPDEEDESDHQDILFEHRINSKNKRRRQHKCLVDEDEDRTQNSQRTIDEQHSPLEEEEVTIFSRNHPIVSPPRSVTGELSSLLMKQQMQNQGKLKKSATSVSFQSINLTDAPSIDHKIHRSMISDRTAHSDAHNCIRSPCTPTLNSDPFYHLYQREQPEGMPYCDTFSMYSPSSTAVNQCIIYRKARLWLAFCLCSHLACAICIVRGWHYFESGTWWMYLMSTVSFTGAVVSTVALGWLPQNMDNRVRHQVPAAPYLALLNTFLLSLMLASADFGGIWKCCLLLAMGLLVYAAYGYKHSLEHLRSLNIAPQTLSSETDENTGLVAPLSAYQMSASTSKNSMKVDPQPASSNGVKENGSC